MSDGDLLSAEDVAGLNSQAVARSGAILRLIGTALVIAGGVGVIAWMWFEVRTQQQISRAPLEFNLTNGNGSGLDLVDRIDVFANSISLLMLSALVVGLGVASRLVADYAIARTGGSVTGFISGDSVADYELTPGDG